MVMPREERPPYVAFEMRGVEDRAATLRNGHYTAKDVPFVLITPQGSKDRVEREVVSWFENLTNMVQERRFPQQWLSSYRAKFEAWKKGEEVPLEGSSIRSWPPISPSQYQILRNMNILTVEDLAQANEETIGRIGQGGRSLVQTAQTWLSQSRDVGKPVLELETLREDHANLIKVKDALQMDRDNLAGQLAQIRQNTNVVVDGANQTQSSGMELDMTEVLADGNAHSP